MCVMFQIKQPSIKSCEDSEDKPSKTFNFKWIRRTVLFPLLDIDSIKHYFTRVCMSLFAHVCGNVCTYVRRGVHVYVFQNRQSIVVKPGLYSHSQEEFCVSEYNGSGM